MVTILFSSITDPSHNGDAVSNGGYKSHELWVKLLRQHGHEAYRVTHDGTTIPWMIEHGPAISINTARAWVNEGRDIRPVTTWMAAREWMDLFGGHVYFYDQELAFTSREHFDVLRQRLPSLKKVGTHSRTIQAWYMTMFGITPDYIPEWSDTDHWMPDPKQQRRGVIGYMREGPQIDAQIELIKQAVQAAGLTAEFTQIAGNERDVLAQMQRCDLFLGMNPGKHPVWGEGCPRSPQEAQHAGCVVIAFDVLGNHEYIADGYTGLMVRTPQEMAGQVVYALQHRGWTESIRDASTRQAMSGSTGSQRWLMAKRFLDL